MSDYILERFMETQRWENAIDIGDLKDMDEGVLKKLTKPLKRVEIYEQITSGKYKIFPPHMAHIPKDNGDTRTVFVNEDMDRIFLSIANDLLYELCPQFIHKTAKAYQKGISTQKTVSEVVEWLGAEKYRAFKADLTKYFDSVQLKYIMEMFDRVEDIYGHSAVIDVLRDYYKSDYCFDTQKELIEHYQSLKQGCAVASFLANALLYHIDEKMSKLNGHYVRYCDDILFVGKDVDKAFKLLKSELNAMELDLNPKKVDWLSDKRFFTFLGFGICGKNITLSKKRLGNWKKEIDKRTINQKSRNPRVVTKKVLKYLYYGDGQFSFATSVLGIINVEKDISEMNKYAMDAIRAGVTGKTKIGGLGYRPEFTDGVIHRGVGKNVKANKEKIPFIEGYDTIECMRKAYITDKDGYNAKVRAMLK